MLRCSECGERKASVMPRPDLGQRLLCADCAASEMARIRPSRCMMVRLRTGRVDDGD